MEGEFERECGEYGGCDGLVRNQYKNIRTQLLSGIVDKDRAATGKEIDELWLELQKNGDIPADDSTHNVTKRIQKAEIQAAAELAEHVKKENEPKFIKRKWKDQKKLKDRRRALLHQMALAALAIDSATVKPPKKRDKGGPALNSPTNPPPTAPIYPTLPVEGKPLPPPYGKANQMPLFVVREGVFNAQVVEGAEYDAEKARLTREAEEAIVKVEQMKRDVQLVQEVIEQSMEVHRESMKLLGKEKAEGRFPSSAVIAEKEEVESDLERVAVGVVVAISVGTPVIGETSAPNRLGLMVRITTGRPHAIEAEAGDRHDQAVLGGNPEEGFSRRDTRLQILTWPHRDSSRRCIELTGFSGRPQSLPLTKPLTTTILHAGQTFAHNYVSSQSCPVNLLGRDILLKCGASILCSPEGLIVTFPNGYTINCSVSTTHSTSQMLLMADNTPGAEGLWADIYWGLVNTPPGTQGIGALYQSWRPWIQSLHPYTPPPDPLHVTLYYDRNGDELYQQAFYSDAEGVGWEIQSTCVWVGKEGVAAAVELTPEQLRWYEGAADASPHISLAIHANHQAKDLGPMCKRLSQLTDWQPTQIPQVLFSPSEGAYQITQTAEDTAVLEHRQIERWHGREKTDHVDAAAMLRALPDSLWSAGSTDVGFCSHISPVTFDLTDSTPIWQTQYRHKPAAEAGIADTIEGLFAAGVLEPSTSKWNTPILPVEKQNTGKYRMAHDLRRINAIVSTPTVPVPNPYTALSSLTPTHQWFSCIDLANAFFCLPLAPHLRDIFSFTYGGQQLQYTRVPQGFILSPGVFNQTLKHQLADLPLPPDVVVIQYVDDILLAAPTPSTCLEATQAVLLRLSDTGFKVSKSKLQCCRQQVSFLGRVVSNKGTALSPSHRESILNHPLPQTVKDMLSFLGLTGYSKNYVAAYGELTHPLRALVNEQGMRNLAAPLNWTKDAESSFIQLKQSMSRAADLAIPDYTLPFFLDVSEKAHTVSGVLFQKKGGGRQVLMYASISLDPTEERHPPCTRHAAGVAKILQKTAHIVMGHALTVLTTHSIVAYVSSAAFTMTSLRQTRLEKILNAPHITFTHEGINMADHIGEGEPHRCEEKVQEDVRVREGLHTKALADAEEILYTDGCCFRHPTEGLKAAYAVVRQTDAGFQEIITETVKGKESSQRAELQAMIAALEWSAGKKVNIYTDSAYVVGAIHVEMPQWMRSGFLTTAKTPIKHKEEMMTLKEALMKPDQVAVIKCKGHDNSGTIVSKGNRAADEAAKRKAGSAAYTTGLVEKVRSHSVQAHFAPPPPPPSPLCQNRKSSSPLAGVLMIKERKRSAV
ncbi:uncharacterized protein LOC115049619 [Echeneis naucrates]|uniref:uncharacterized protein LOC115049619 n=1 Tax=Echeneis naucrates TaxID=173247 RepID=UPI0011132E1A|nr:uncharacterized protein LOC115049619 [Echeneis naucrates]